MYLLDVSIRDLKYFCVLFVLFVFLFMLLALLRCYTSIFDGFIFRHDQPRKIPFCPRYINDDDDDDCNDDGFCPKQITHQEQV